MFDDIWLAIGEVAIYVIEFGNDWCDHDLALVDLRSSVSEVINHASEGTLEI
jgi:hypothetical protein